MNSTFVSVAQLREARAERAAAPGKIKLDCNVTGYPTPWIQWFRNGKLLRNKPNGRLSIRTSKWRRRHNVQVSRLEFALQPGKNETGIYECRAMSVVAREPSIGTYTLLVLPAQYALIPLRPEGELEKPSPPPANRPGPAYLMPAEAGSSSNATLAGQSNGTAANTTELATSTTPAPAPSSPASAAPEAGEQATKAPAEADATTPDQAAATKQQQPVGLPCPVEARDNFCLNKGTCVHLEHIKEYYCR